MEIKKKIEWIFKPNSYGKGKKENTPGLSKGISRRFVVFCFSR